MPESKRPLGSDLVRLDAATDEDIARQIAEDPDTAPELTDADLAEAEIWEGGRFIRRVGRPKGSGTKELVSLRLDRDILDFFREGGPGWQTRINDYLRGALELNRPPARRDSRREKLLKLIRGETGLSRGEILERMGIKGDKSGEMSVSNALTTLVEKNQGGLKGGKYRAR